MQNMLACCLYIISYYRAMLWEKIARITFVRRDACFCVGHPKRARVSGRVLTLSSASSADEVLRCLTCLETNGLSASSPRG